jgi:hypothetical protein
VNPDGESLTNTAMSDAYVGARFHASRGMIATFGASVAGASGAQTSFRVIAGLKIFPPEPEKKPQVVIVEKSTVVEIKHEQKCAVKPFNGVFFARRLTTKELADHPVLPYLSTPEHPLKTVQLGGITGFLPGNLPYVEDSQTVFAVDISNLPRREAVVSVDDISLQMDVRKVSTGQAADAEILCFLEEQVCSGELHRTHGWAKNVNPDFFHGKETPNDFYIRQYIGKKLNWAGRRQILGGEIQLPFEKLLENTPHGDLTTMLYPVSEAASKASGGKRTLYFVAADNTYIALDARVVVNMKHNSCESSDSTSTSKKETVHETQQ